jgi:peroxiredoxin
MTMMKAILRCISFLSVLSVAQGFVGVALLPGPSTRLSSSAISSSTMSDVVSEVKVGDKIPSITLMEGLGDFEKREVNIAELIAGKKVAIFGVPGAFTPGCSRSHLPSFIEAQSELKEKGVELTICIATNDLYVMEAWGRESGGKDAGIIFLSDSNAELSKALGLLMEGGILPRTRRFSLIADNGVVTHYFSSAKESSDTWAPAVLAKL